MSLNFHKAVQQQQQTCLMFPTFEAAHQRMEVNLRLHRRTVVAQNLLVLGESGTGTTTSARWFARRYQRFAGVFRLVCLNGLMVPDTTLGAIKVPHTGKVQDKVV